MLKLNLMAQEVPRATRKKTLTMEAEPMIYKCSTCHEDLIFLRTKGDKVNYDFTCKDCIEVLRKNIERHKGNGAFLKKQTKEKK